MVHMQLQYTYMDSPVGQLLLAGEGETLHYLSFPTGKMAIKPAPDWIFYKTAFKSARQQIEAYFLNDCEGQSNTRLVFRLRTSPCIIHN